jgi:hypothetical protein
VLEGADLEPGGGFRLMEFERGHTSILAAPLPVGGGTSVVLELFDKPPPGFSEADRRLVASAAEVGADLLRQALAERQTHRLLFDAVGAALTATKGVASVIEGAQEQPREVVLEQLRKGLAEDVTATASAESTLRLAEAVRALAHRHGAAAVDHSIRLITDVGKLLDELTGNVVR